MSNITSLRPLAAVMAAALAATLLIALPSRSDGATTINYPNTERIPGDDPVEIGVNISQRLFGNDGAQAVVLARKDKFPDALGGSALAAEFGGPILYTTSTDLDTATRNEIDRVLSPGDNVYIMGGEAAIAPAVEQELDARGYRTPRLAGITRVETAAESAFAVGAGPGRTAIIARAFDDPGAIESTQGWVDSVSCGGYAAFRETPVLLTDKNRDPERIPEATRSMLQRLGISEVFICGGPAAVPQAHADDIAAMGIKVNRFAGATRIETAVDVASNLWGYGTTDGKAFIIVNGWGANFSYGLAASQLSRREAAPILLVNSTEPTSCSGTDQSRATLCYLAQHNPSISGLIAVGDVSLVNDIVFRAAAEAGGLEEDNTAPSRPSNVSATDRPEDNGRGMVVKWAASTDDNPGPVTYNVYFRNNSDEATLTRGNSTRRTTGKTSLTITGLTEGESYDVAVDAVDQFGNRSGLSAVASAGPLEDEVPAAPDEAPTASNTTTGVRLRWKAAPEADAAAYRIERAAPVEVVGPIQEPCDSPFLSWTHVRNADGRTTTTTIDTTAADGTRYCYRYRVLDTSSPANQSGPSPVAEWTFEKANADQTPPPGAPTLYAINVDQQRGLVNVSGNSRMRMGTDLRVDTIVPNGSYANGDKGTIAIFDDETLLGESDEFTATGNQQVITTIVSIGSERGELSINARMRDETGNQSNASTPWLLNVSPEYAATPHITSIANINTAPASNVDKRIPSVSSPDPTPLIAIGNLEPSGPQLIRLFRNEVQDAQFCVTPNQIPGGTFELNDDDGPVYTIGVDAAHRLVASTEPVLSCPAVVPVPSGARRSGDSNTVVYNRNQGAFGLVSVSPSGLVPEGSVDELTVVFDKLATTGSSIQVFNADTGAAETGEFTNNGTAGGEAGGETAGDNRIHVELDPAIGPGSYELEVKGHPFGGQGSSVVTKVPFVVGIVGFVHATRAEDTTGNSRPSAGTTLVVAPTAPDGAYTAFTDDACTMAAGPPINHTTGTNASRQPALVPISAIFWRFDGGACQADGLMPAALVDGDRAKVGIRPRGVPADAFTAQIDGLVLSDQALIYRPGGSSSSWRTGPAVAVTPDGDPGIIPNANVRPGDAVFYYVRNSNGNESAPLQDGSLVGLSSIRANNAGTVGRLEVNDSLELIFSGASFDTALQPPVGNNGGARILVGPQGNRRLVNSRLEAASGGSDGSFPNATTFLIKFGSATTVGGQPVPQAVSAPTLVDGGLDENRWLGVDWLIDIGSDRGHSVLLPPVESPTQVNTTF